ncbi:MAG: hypothetical protein ACM3X7_01595 [Solirubrobacterales bacterium]
MKNYSMEEQFIKYLNSKGVIFETRNNLSKDNNISNQLKIISKFHKIAAGYREYSGCGLKDGIGKDIEKSKVEMKKFKKIIQGIKLMGPENIFEEALLNMGYHTFEKAQRALKISESEKYLGLLKRSMDNGEICIGEPSFKNIWGDNNIRISKINKCSYNIVESDGVVFFRRLKRKGYKFNLEGCIDEYCTLENLDQFSREYMSSLLTYPYYTIRYCIRYKDKKYNISEIDYLNKLTKVVSYDC